MLRGFRPSAVLTALAAFACCAALTIAVAAPAQAGIPPGFPNAGNTGLTNPGALKVHNGNLTVTQDGAVIQNLEIRGRVEIMAKNVVMRNVWVYTSDFWTVFVKSGSLRIEDSEIGRASVPGKRGIGGSNVTARRVDIHNVEDGIKAGDNSLYERVYCHDLASGANAHPDCFQDDGGHNNYTVRDSTLDARLAGGGLGNSAVIIKSSLGPIRNATLDSNYLNGGNKIVMIGKKHSKPTGIVIRENAFGRDVRHPPGVLQNNAGSVIVWENNYFADTGQYIDTKGNPTDPLPVEQGTRPCKSAPCDSLGVVDGGGRWRLHNALSADASVKAFYFGNPGDVAFMGDWDGDGIATPGLYRRSDGFVYLRHSNTQGNADITFFFGKPGDLPLVGDYNGNGKDTVSIYRPGEARVYVINRLGKNGGGLGAADFAYYLGKPGDKPFVGDFNGDGKDSVGLHRPSTGLVYFRNSLTPGNAEKKFVYGNPGDVILAGDWDGDGDDTVAVYRPSTSRVYINLKNAPGQASYTLRVGRYPIAVGWGRE